MCVRAGSETEREAVRRKEVRGREGGPEILQLKLDVKFYVIWLQRPLERP